MELSGWASGTVSADAVAIESVTDSPGNQAIWTLPLATPDKYDVFARWGTNDSGASTAKHAVTHAGGTDTVTMNQNVYAGYWNKLGTYDLAPNAGHNVNLSDRTDSVVQADAIRLVSTEGAERVARWEGTVASSGTYQVWARWPAAPTHTFAASYDIITPSGTETVTVNQRIEGGRWHLLKTITLAANDNWKVELSDQSPGEVVADAVALTPPLSLADQFDWSPTLPSAGDYAVYAKWQAASDRATDVTYEVTHSNGVDLVKADQTHNGGEWRYLGTWNFDPSQSPKVSLLASLNGTVNADAVRFVAGDAVGGDIVYSHSDQLGTIQKLSDASGTLVWDRIARPFGETVSISAASGVEQRLRFPGQYADETGLSYNYFRDYDPTLGRYFQSDAIGLAGGINTYGYAGQNSIANVDARGLQASNMKCHPERQKILQFQVDKWCSWQGVRRCEDTDSCEENARKLSINSKCADARKQINDECYGGGSPEHQEAYEDAVNAVKRCKEKRESLSRQWFFEVQPHNYPNPVRPLPGGQPVWPRPIWVP